MVNRSMCSWSATSWDSQTSSAASSIAEGPHTHAERVFQSDTIWSSSVSSTFPSSWVSCRCSRYPRCRLSSSRSSSWKITDSADGAEWMCTMSGSCPRARRERSIAMIGVMPLPAVMNSSDSGGGSGSVNSPCGAASLMMVPGSTPSTRWVDKNPSGVALTVIEISPSVCSGTEVSE